MKTYEKRDLEIFILRSRNPKYWTFKQLGDYFGITAARVQQILSKKRKYDQSLAEYKERKEIWEQTEDKKTWPIEALELHHRPYNCLCRGKVKTIGELVDKCNIEELLKIRNLGISGIEQIKSALAKYGFTLKEREDEKL
jgi:DNA-directed RNA polymerase alpha subunit